MSLRVYAVDAGLSYHHVALAGRYRQSFAAVGYLRAPEGVRFEDYDALLVPCRTPARLLEPLRERVAAYLDDGGTVVAMGETAPQRWLPQVDFTPLQTNYWWWRDKTADLGLRVTAPGHTLFEHLTPGDLVWHVHGHLTPPAGARTLVETRDGGCLLFDDTGTWPGRLIATTLDPFYHHGSRFMPATTRFLDGFLAWLVSLPSRRDRVRRAS